jgi:hypothetical protein
MSKQKKTDIRDYCAAVAAKIIESEAEVKAVLEESFSRIQQHNASCKPSEVIFDAQVALEKALQEGNKDWQAFASQLCDAVRPGMRKPKGMTDREICEWIISQGPGAVREKVDAESREAGAKMNEAQLRMRADRDALRDVVKAGGELTVEEGVRLERLNSSIIE